MAHLINGSWIEGSGTLFTSIDPSNEETVWTGFAATEAEVAAAVAAARDARDSWAMTPLADRIATAERYAAILTEEKAALAELIAREAGKVLWDAEGEATAMINKVGISVRAHEERTGTKEAVNGLIRSRLTHRPHGVMAVFGPYNFPGHLPNGHIVPALIAGNTIVFKPSELTPAVAEFMAKAWMKAGLPDGVFNLVQGARAVGEALAGDPGIDGLLFTGSVRGGQSIARTLIDRPEVIQALEMGGNNPLIVHEVNDLDAAAVLTILSAFVSSGQRCTCARRLIVPVGEAGDRFLARLIAAMKGIRVGSWSDTADVFMGPVVSAAAADMVLKAEGDLIAKGAKALVECAELPRGEAFLSPGLLDVTDVKTRPDAEIFGPLLQLIRVPDFEAAVAEANNTRFGLASGLISDSRALFESFYPRARAGIVNWNQQLTGAASTAPFGGIGLSGNHRPSAYYAADYAAYPVATMEQAEGRVAVAANPKGLVFERAE
ncbi:succinylglutamate-semialdehyde dehydrogenase [Gimibacter soli]|uniref:Succinylglutamate-semialdehyde dehydrogenase n=1 Tax=Gimibacter soli TaxID=3024400 RepID=A0AAF0BM76_9PROT|nr:succinylglutamate-semialdehyde dehydrogenase [Gimibacter soli]WCL55157.1 succinylglutamate-semialdehyde dehydrogenase [Gimibacter soli]